MTNIRGFRIDTSGAHSDLAVFERTTVAARVEAGYFLESLFADWVEDASHVTGALSIDPRAAGTREAPANRVVLDGFGMQSHQVTNVFVTEGATKPS